MNPSDQSEFDHIVQNQLRLRSAVADLDRRIDALGKRLAGVSPPEPAEPIAMPSTVPATPRTVPAPHLQREVPPPIPKPAAEKPAPIAEIPGRQPTKPDPAPTKRDSIELTLGTYWLVRIGIVILLTGFVFLGNYAYHHIVPLLGPWGKLALLALGGGALTGAGAWLERTRETMRNYARVLLAGGAATFYYTAYAAHFVASLRVIESALLGGALLLLLAGGFLWFAERRHSEPLAIGAVLLSYYTAAINPIGSFSLFSNLLLTAVAVVFLVRHRWVAISFASLAATYASFGFWRFHALVSTGESGSGTFGLALAFLAGYWLLFTAAVFLSHRDAFPLLQRTAFLTANNGALFIYAAQQFNAHRPDAFWLFAAGFGAVLLGLAALAAWRRPEDRSTDGAYLAQGLAMLGLGCAAKFSGPQLATVFAVESAVLLTVARARQRTLCEIAAVLAALAASGLALFAFECQPEHTLALGGSVILILFFDAWWLRRSQADPTALPFSGRALAFAAPGLLLTAVVLWKTVPPVWQPTAFAATALLAALSVRVVPVPEIVLPGQAFLLVGTGLLLTRPLALYPAWNTVLPIAISLTLSHWWQHQRRLRLAPEAARALQFAAAATAASIGVWWLWTVPPSSSAGLLITSAVALGSLLYGTATRSRAIAIIGQVFTACSLLAFLRGLITPADSYALLAPIVNLAVIAILLTRLPANRAPDDTTLVHIVRLYRAAANLLLACWGFSFVENAWLPSFYAALGTAHILGGAVLRERERTFTGALFGAAALAFFWLRFTGTSWLDLAAILVLPGSLRLGRRLAGRDITPPTVRDALVIAALASLWLWVTRTALASGWAPALTAAWALLALAVLGSGLAFRERLYRTGGLVILALAVGRIFVIDVWQLETLYRIISFLILGTVLLILGYLYNRFADAIRRWL
ncbi:MAG: DUF2339 domain-containing protein [Chthoniobacter sp.]|nr:DUF2339 domain-containing protein [Chthoniobacter sp.]